MKLYREGFMIFIINYCSSAGFDTFAKNYFSTNKDTSFIKNYADEILKSNLLQNNPRAFVLITHGNQPTDILSDVISKLYKEVNANIYNFNNVSIIKEMNENDDDESYESDDDERRKYDILGDRNYFLLLFEKIDLEELVNSFVELSASTAWNPRSNHLLLLTSVVKDEPQEMRGMFKIFWERFSLLNILAFYRTNAIKENELEGCKFHLVKYQPFSGEMTDVFSLWQSDKHIKLYSEKLIDVKGHSISLSFYDDPPSTYITVDASGNVTFGGFLVTPILTCIEKMNGKAVVTSMSNKLRSFGVEDSSLNDSADVYVFVRPLTKISLRQSTYPHDIEHSSCLVPKAEQIPKYLSLFIPFSKEVWACVVLSYLVLTLTWHLLRLVTVVDKGSKLFRNINLQMFRIAVHGTISDHLVKSKLRFFVMFLVCLSFLVNATYTGLITSHLTSPSYYKDIDTLDELASSDLKIGIPLKELTQTDMDTFDLTDEVTLKLLVKFIPMSDSYSILEMAVAHRNVSKALLTSEAVYLLNNASYYKEGYPQLHVVKQPFLAFPLGYILKHNSPYTSRIYSLMRRLVESGLYQKMKSNAVYGPESISGYRPDSLKPLSREHLQAVFYALALGLSFSVSLFVTEVSPWIRTTLSWVVHRAARTF